MSRHCLPCAAGAGLLAAFLLGGCASGQMNRIDANRDIYETWPIETRQAVLDGKVEPGMLPEMVKVAWGTPSEVVASPGGGPGDGPGDEIWVYKKGGFDDSAMMVYLGRSFPGGGYSGSGYPGSGYPGAGYLVLPAGSARAAGAGGSSPAEARASASAGGPAVSASAAGAGARPWAASWVRMNASTGWPAGAGGARGRSDLPVERIGEGDTGRIGPDGAGVDLRPDRGDLGRSERVAFGRHLHVFDLALEILHQRTRGPFARQDVGGAALAAVERDGLHIEPVAALLFLRPVALEAVRRKDRAHVRPEIRCGEGEGRGEEEDANRDESAEQRGGRAAR